MKAIILCAGKGERLMPLTESIPKPMVSIDNKPVLEYLILLCKKHNIKDIAINTSYLPEKIKEYFEDGSKFGVNLTYSFEPELLGTAGALNNFKDFIGGEPFFVIYGDAITDIDLEKLMKEHLQKKGIATLSLRKKPSTKPPESLVFVNDSLQITKFIEKPSQETFLKLCKEHYLSNSGIYVLEPEILKYIPEGFSDFGKDIFPEIVKQEKDNLYAFMMDNYYFREVGKIEKYNLAKQEIESGKVKLNLLSIMNKAVFLDRDGVLNENLYETDGKIMSPANLSQLKIIPGAKEGISEFKKMGFKIIVVSNQPGVAFRYITQENLSKINSFLKQELGIDEIYCCTHHPNEKCKCRKPNPEMIFKAVKDFNIDIKKSYMVGDSLSDIQTGNNAQVKNTFLIGVVREDVLAIQHKKHIFPDFTLPNLLEVAEKIKKIEKI